jgi:hypothetical protein
MEDHHEEDGQPSDPVKAGNRPEDTDVARDGSVLSRPHERGVYVAGL